MTQHGYPARLRVLPATAAYGAKRAQETPSNQFFETVNL